MRLPLTTSIPISTAAPAPSKSTEGAARQFEALLIGQMLRTARESSRTGLSGEDGDSSSETMLDVADQQFSQLLAKNGGLGLAKMIQSGLKYGVKNVNP